MNQDKDFYNTEFINFLEELSDDTDVASIFKKGSKLTSEDFLKIYTEYLEKELEKKDND